MSYKKTRWTDPLNERQHRALNNARELYELAGTGHKESFDQMARLSRVVGMDAVTFLSHYWTGNGFQYIEEKMDMSARSAKWCIRFIADAVEGAQREFELVVKHPLFEGGLT